MRAGVVAPGEDVAHLGSASSMINVSFGVAFQRNNWGDTLQRCQVQVAFTRTGESDGMGMGDSSVQEHIQVPEEEGPQAQSDLEWLVRAAGDADPVSHGPLIDEVRSALDDDLDAPRARAALLATAQSIEDGAGPPHRGCLVAAASLCGIDLRE